MSAIFTLGRLWKGIENYENLTDIKRMNKVYLDERSMGVRVLDVPGIICGLLYVVGVDDVDRVNGKC